MIKKTIITLAVVTTFQLQSSSLLNTSFSEADVVPHCATLRPLVLNGKRVEGSHRPAVVALALAQITSPLNSSNGMSPTSFTMSPNRLSVTPVNSLPNSLVAEIRLDRNDTANDLFEEYRTWLFSLRKDMDNIPLSAQMEQFRTDLLAYQAKEDAWFAEQKK